MARRGCACSICEALNQPAVCSLCVNLGLTERYKLLKRLFQERDILRRRLDEELKAKREADNQQHWRIERAERAPKLSDRLRGSERKLIQGRSRKDQKSRDLETYGKLLAAASAQLSNRRSEFLGHLYPELLRTQNLNHSLVLSELFEKRRQVFRQLFKVLPLRYSEDRRGKSKDRISTQILTVCGASLPVGDDPRSVSPIELSASLGYMVQLVNQFARYLSAPLLHSAAFAASSSRIWQRTSYWDARPSSRSEEYPLFVPRKGARSATPEASIRLDKGSGLGESGFCTLDSSSLLRSKSTCSFNSLSVGVSDSDKDVQQGIKLLKRSISCICAYGYARLNIPAPSDVSTFEALMELITLLSSKEAKTRPNRVNLKTDGSSMKSDSLNQGTGKGSDFFYIAADSYNNNININMKKKNDRNAALDGWDMVEHPTLPPPPSHSEDVEHWTRAMFVDATK